MHEPGRHEISQCHLRLAGPSASLASGSSPRSHLEGRGGRASCVRGGQRGSPPTSIESARRGESESGRLGGAGAARGLGGGAGGV